MLTIISFDFYSNQLSNSKIFDYFFNVFGEITFISCSFNNINSYNSIIISYNSVYFVNVSINNITIYSSFLQGLTLKNYSQFYSFSYVNVNNLTIQIPISGALLTCERCSINVSSSCFRYFSIFFVILKHLKKQFRLLFLYQKLGDWRIVFFENSFKFCKFL